MIDFTRYKEFITQGEYIGIDILPNTPQEVIDILKKIDEEYFSRTKSHIINNFRKEGEYDEAYERAKQASEEVEAFFAKFKKNDKGKEKNQ